MTDEFHPDAHTEATNIEGEGPYGEWGQCIASNRHDERCGGHAKGPHGKCHSHGGSTPTKEEDPSVGASEGNFRSLKTGDNVAADRWIEFINEHADEDFKAMFRGQWERFRDQGADPVVATRLAVMWSKADYNNMELLKEGFTRPEYHEGEYVGDVFDSDRDNSALQNEREARLFRREEQLTPNSKDSDVAGGVESIAEIFAEVVDS